MSKASQFCEVTRFQALSQAYAHAMNFEVPDFGLMQMCVCGIRGRCAMLEPLKEFFAQQRNGYALCCPVVC